MFKVTPVGAEAVLYSSGSKAADGTNPFAGLINVDGTLYGTTYAGGGAACGCGTVFRVTRKGIETVLYSFQGYADGAIPLAGFLNLGDSLYGTTQHGSGADCGYGCGTVFAVTTAGSGTLLHPFGCGEPTANLVNIAGTLYGTASGFGAGGGSPYGWVFSITPAGILTILYSFRDGTDGANPTAGLINLHGALYGTTIYGGGSSNCIGGCGTVFKVTRAGDETVLHSFGGGSDGAFPAANLTNVGGTLFGTTSQGGGTGCYSGAASGCGTVFKLDP